MPATEPGRVSLLMTEGPSAGLRILMPIKESAIIGRHQKCQVVIDHPLISRRHCTVTAARDGSGVEIMDLDSNNGVRVDGERITGGVTVAIGKKFRVGPATFEVQRWEAGSETDDGSDLDRDDVLDILGLSADDPSLQAMPTDEWDETASGGAGQGVSKVFELDNEAKPVQIAKAVREFATSMGVQDDDLQELGIEVAALCESVVRLDGTGELSARVLDGELKVEVSARFVRAFKAK